jgi:hypothetical protein
MEVEDNLHHEKMTNTSLRAQVEGLEDDLKSYKSENSRQKQLMGEKDEDIFKWKQQY